MRKRVLLIDESLTVQKVVALTLDKSRFSILYAKTRAEAMRLVVENAPQLILVSDQVPDINIGAFPKEVEVWLNRRAPVPPILLITAQDLKEVRHYSAVLKKPFSPQNLQKLVTEKTNIGDAGEAPAKQPMAPPGSNPEDFEDQRLQKIFNDAFSDESRLVRETLETEATGSYNVSADDEPTMPAAAVPQKTAAAKPANWPPQVQRNSDRQEPARAVPVPPKTPPATMWESAPAAQAGNPGLSRTTGTSAPEVMSSADSHAYKATLDNKVGQKIEEADLQAIVEKALEKMLPPIVEKLVQARLDALMKEQEQFLELKS